MSGPTQFSEGSGKLVIDSPRNASYSRCSCWDPDPTQSSFFLSLRPSDTHKESLHFFKKETTIGVPRICFFFFFAVVVVDIVCVLVDLAGDVAAPHKKKKRM
jgi:hypothetical protein